MVQLAEIDQNILPYFIKNGTLKNKLIKCYNHSWRALDNLNLLQHIYLFICFWMKAEIMFSISLHLAIHKGLLACVRTLFNEWITDRCFSENSNLVLPVPSLSHHTSNKVEITHHLSQSKKWHKLLLCRYNKPLENNLR